MCGGLFGSSGSLFIFSGHTGPACDHPEGLVPTMLMNTLRTDLAAARRSRDKARTLVLSTVLADLRNREIELGTTLEDDGVQAVIARAIKQRRDAAEQMTAGGRPELAERELAQAAVLGEYLPPDLTAAEVRAMVREIMAGGGGHMGAVMSSLMPRIRGRFDGKAASAIVREELAGR